MTAIIAISFSVTQFVPQEEQPPGYVVATFIAVDDDIGNNSRITYSIADIIPNPAPGVSIHPVRNSTTLGE